MEMRDPNTMPVGLEHMRRLVADNEALKRRVEALERFVARMEKFENGAAGEALRSNGDGTASWAV